MKWAWLKEGLVNRTVLQKQPAMWDPVHMMVFLSFTVTLPPPFPLKEVQVPIVENRLCDSKYHKGLITDDSVHIVRDDMLCAGYENHDSCQVSPCPHTLPPLTSLYRDTDPYPL